MNQMAKNLSSEVWKRFTSGYSRIEKLQMKKMAKHKLTIPQFHVLEVLLNTGTMPLKKIGNELNVTGANITCVVDNLEKQDLVVRVPSTEDRRIINAELTEKGEKTIQTIFPEYLEFLEDTTTNLEINEKREFIRLLNKLVA